MNLAALTASLPNGFALPFMVGTVYEYYESLNRDSYTSLALWVPSGTSIADAGYSAPPGAVLTPGFWSQTGFITVADGSCWGINVGRTSSNNGTISFQQQPLGSACAA